MRVEAGGEYDAIELVQLAVPGTDAPFLDSFDTRINELRSGLLDRVVELSRDHEAFTSSAIVGR